MKKPLLMMLSLAACGAVATPAVAAQNAQKGQAASKAAMSMPTPAEKSACTNAADDIINKLDAGDVSAATSHFDPRLHAKMTDAKLQAGWKKLTDKYGKNPELGTPQARKVKKYTLVMVPMSYNKAQLGAQVACNSKGKVLAFRIGAMKKAPSKS
ncbi:DUF3887 domain-containing protein [Oleiagrimonas sp. C23AA]|uniref:DUF3887 domain-containing protein n=1 Tax=Oleiagrimonas sp. C23AA TaxID=2719047 RepID=UPI00142223CC|nr:DUF3887 domain-containing protein [Oleiagrimonas sp. C23AA]NII11667.1 DUF3887 domain-containing protein [Oleiagrimonas sp. C23AA]